MKGTLQLSIVVVANDHNPTILNPDFLIIQGIVPSDWGWKLASPPLTTPPLSQVKYDSGVSITVESNKLQVSDERSSSVAESRIAGIVTKYVENLPHVRYISVGNNFAQFIDLEEPSNYIHRRFIKSGSWERDLISASLKLAYPLSGGRLVLSIDGAKRVEVVGDKSVQIDGLLATANFHRTVESGRAPKDQIVNGVAQLVDDFKKFQTMINEVVGLE